MVEIPNVRLYLSNAPENVSIVQLALGGVAETLGLDALDAGNLDTAVAEACKNVVLHAYDGTEGPLELEVYALPGAIDVVVRDHGMGIRPLVGERKQPHTGIGLPIVHVLTQRVVYSNLAGGGTEMRMQFVMPAAAALDPLAEDGPELPLAGRGERADTIEMALAPAAVTRAVLPRVLGALAARAAFSAERISDVQRVADAVAADASDAITPGHLGVTVRFAPHELDLRIGPLRAGTAAGLLDSTRADLGPLLERGSEAPRVDACGSLELLSLNLRERS